MQVLVDIKKLYGITYESMRKDKGREMRSLQGRIFKKLFVYSIYASLLFSFLMEVIIGNKAFLDGKATLTGVISGFLIMFSMVGILVMFALILLTVMLVVALPGIIIALKALMHFSKKSGKS